MPKNIFLDRTHFLLLLPLIFTNEPLIKAKRKEKREREWNFFLLLLHYIHVWKAERELRGISYLVVIYCHYLSLSPLLLYCYISKLLLLPEFLFFIAIKAVWILHARSPRSLILSLSLICKFEPKHDSFSPLELPPDFWHAAFVPWRKFTPVLIKDCIQCALTAITTITYY